MPRRIYRLPDTCNLVKLFRSSDVQRRGISPGNYSAVVGTKMQVSPTWYVSVGDTVEINCTTHTDRSNNSNKMDLQLVWTKMGSNTKKVWNINIQTYPLTPTLS